MFQVALKLNEKFHFSDLQLIFIIRPFNSVGP